MNEPTSQPRLDAIVRQRWDCLLRRIEESEHNTIWVIVDESLEDWQDLKAMTQRGIVFPGVARYGAKEMAWHAYERSRQYFESRAV